MNKEQLFCLIGELDDRFLEKYRQMDLYLSQRAYRKKRTLRILAIAACLALVIGACVPVGMMATPAGNAVLTEQLNRIDGFRPWQESVAEKLEQSLSEPAWKLLQTTPILNVLTQSQYPDYAFKSMQYGAYLDEPEYLIYNVSSKGGFFPDEENFSFDRTEYRDPDAAPYYELSFGQPSSEITLSLPYVLSLTASLQSQAVHMYYQVQEDGTEYYAFVDAQTGACVCKEYFGASEQPSAFALTEQEMLDAAYEVLASNVRDPEAYTPNIYEQSGFYYCEYIRYVGDRKSCDRAIVRFDRAGDMRSIKFSYLGAMRNAQEVPQQMIDQINAYMEQLCEGCVGTSTQDVGQVVVLPDGRLALQCYLQVYYWGTGWNTGLQHDDMYFMACLTESVPGYGELAGTQDAEALTTEPPETSPNTTEPDTTEPESGKPQGNGLRIWDAYHPDDSERYPYFSVTLPSLRNAKVEHREDGTVYLNGEYLLGDSGSSCSSFYLSDLTSDGIPELCFGISTGYGTVCQSVVMIDFTTREVIFTMDGRLDYDYYLFLRDGVLCVKETEYMKRDAVRTGALTCNGSEISVAWDSEVNATVDRDPMPEPGEPIH